MAILRTFLFQNRIKLLNGVKTHTQPAATVIFRNASTMEITKNLSLYSEDKKQLKDKWLIQPNDKPLVIMLSWLLAKGKHISKYADIYTKNGFDVLNVNINPWQMLWPPKGTHVVAADIIKFLDTNRTYSPLFIHGFSVGGYVWAEALVQLEAEQDRYRHVIDRFKGQVWDSLADITEIPEGFPFAVFPENQFLQNMLRKYILYHLNTFDKQATRHYRKARTSFHNSVVRCPALLYVSKTDPVGSEKSNLLLKQKWEEIGISVRWKCWDKSPHIQHFYHHQQEYTALLNQFLGDLGLIRSEQIQAKAKL